MPIRAQPGRCDPGVVAPVVLGTGDADAVAQRSSCLGLIA
jgi:hypothetical protein